MITTSSVIEEATRKKIGNRYRPAMIESVEIKNFRCFEKIAVSGLGKVNVVVGNNSAGKTAFLEAIFLSQMANPEVVNRLRTWRGLGSAEMVMSRSGYESFWRDLFFKQKQNRKIEIRTEGSAENSRDLKVYYQPDEYASVSVPANGSKFHSDDSSSIVPITFEIKDASGTLHEFKPELVPGGFRIKNTGLPSLAAFYSSSFAAIVGPSEAATQFSELSKKSEVEKLNRLITSVYPRVKKLSVENFGGNWMLHCNVPETRDKIPLGLISSGVQKLIAILVGMASHRNGMVLVDELDNGFYYKALPKVWEALYSFAKEFNVQLLVSTHSQECLQALRPLIRKVPDDFHLIRIEEKDGKHSGRVFSGKSFVAALDTETEVRG